MSHSLIADVPERPTNIAVLEACSLLNAVDEESRQVLAGESFMAYAERGEAIWIAGAPSVFTGIVGVGFVKMAKSSAAGMDVAVELLGPGQCFGLMAALEGRPFPLSAIAVSNTWYLKVPTRALIPVYQACGPFKDQLLRTLTPRLRRAHDMMGRLSSGRVEERLAAVLLLLADSYGRRGDGGVELAVPLTRQDLAEMAGTTVETTIRIMSRWQKEGIVTTESRRITVRDEEQLAATLHA
ncbi:MAG: Crp/Fnr family transcriptional regulator [Fimbriimonadaceae bacterium]|nr:Crp/Fnr family transcriptional regulator [Chthonomonadaceae bacterium]MCO5297468.1 Crp/Fnr family transcriptional regulator [Fimbriimonadaceae bacterium]